MKTGESRNITSIIEHLMFLTVLNSAEFYGQQLCLQTFVLPLKVLALRKITVLWGGGGGVFLDIYKNFSLAPEHLQISFPNSIDSHLNISVSVFGKVAQN